MRDFGWIRAALAVCLVRVGLPAHLGFFAVFGYLIIYLKPLLYPIVAVGDDDGYPPHPSWNPFPTDRRAGVDPSVG